MADTIYLKKRLIGKEDINFDISGTNETENFITPDGVQKPLTKLNASHFPLTQETREKLNAENVDDALQVLSDKAENIKPSDALSEDITIEFLSDDNTDTIQEKINAQKKNLNGHTITFLFPATLRQELYSSLVWHGFYNGSIIISGGSKNSRIEVSDLQDITALFKFYRCLCEVQIEYFDFVHNQSVYGILAESTSSLIIKNCNFSGMTNVDSYASALIASNAFFVDCEFVNDLYFYPYVKTDYLPTGGGTMTGDILSTSDRTMEIIAGQNRNTAPRISIIGGNVPISDENYDKRGGIELVAKDGTGNNSSTLYLGADVTGNHSATLYIGPDALEYQGQDITLGYPDYTSGVDVGEVSSYTAEADGWCYFEKLQEATYIIAKVNGYTAVSGGGSSYDRTSGFYPVKKDDIITFFRRKRDQELDDTELETETTMVIFYPNR